MKTSVKTILLIMILSLPLAAQMHHPMMPSNPRMESMMIYHMTEYLELSPEQAETFFPMMRSHQDKMEACYDKIRALCDKTNQEAGSDTYSEKDLETTLSALQNIEKEILEEKENFILELKPVLSPSQRAKLLFFDEEFRKQLRMRLKQTEHYNKRRRP
ncbi:MAG: periplasmic heavy metal sensor [Candidatus Marinimicrobia bacterium]|nr:periplasmic heavy metal sensor [Candidatus Neomarinimicrobiota bacterium]